MLERALSLSAGTDPSSDANVRKAVAAACTDARCRGLEAERMLVELKRAWYSIPESASHERADVVSRLVTLCILGFYAEETPGAG